MEESEWTEMIHEMCYENARIMDALLRYLNLRWVKDNEGNKYLIETEKDKP